jgi:hypothetical protein
MECDRFNHYHYNNCFIVNILSNEILRVKNIIKIIIS